MDFTEVKRPIESETTLQPAINDCFGAESGNLIFPRHIRIDRFHKILQTWRRATTIH